MGSSQGSNRWKPEKIDQEQVRDLVRSARFHLSRIESLAQLRSYFLEDHYGEAFEAVQDLYQALDLDKLVQDNADRYKRHKKKVRKVHGDG